MQNHCKTNAFSLSPMQHQSKTVAFSWEHMKSNIKTQMLRVNLWKTLGNICFPLEPMEKHRFGVHTKKCPDLDLDKNGTKVKPYWSNLPMDWNPLPKHSKYPDLDLDESCTEMKHYWSNLLMVWNQHQDIQIYPRKPWRRDVMQWRDASVDSYAKHRKPKLFSLIPMQNTMKPMPFRWFLWVECEHKNKTKAFSLPPKQNNVKPLFVFHCFLKVECENLYKIQVFHWFPSKTQ